MNVEILSLNPNNPSPLPAPAPALERCVLGRKIKDTAALAFAIGGPMAGIITADYNLDTTSYLVMSGFAWGGPVIGGSLAISLKNDQLTEMICAYMKRKYCSRVNAYERFAHSSPRPECLLKFIQVIKVALRTTGSVFVFYGAMAVNSLEGENPLPYGIVFLGSIWAFSPEIIAAIANKIKRSSDPKFEIESDKEMLVRYQRTPEQKQLLDREIDLNSTVFRTRLIAGHVLFISSMITSFLLWSNPMGWWDPNIDRATLLPVMTVLNSVMILGPLVATPIYANPRVSTITKLMFRALGLMIAACSYFPMETHLKSHEKTDGNQVFGSWIHLFAFALLVGLGPELQMLMEFPLHPGRGGHSLDDHELLVENPQRADSDIKE